ncbi:MAG: AAA family ATPase [Cyanobacteria bacterium P01_H01_bin.121]
MPDSHAVPFANNWAYIKTELNWLDRVLVMAVGRQRKDLKDLETLARSQADRVTHHWWKGIITLDMPPNYDEGRPALRPTTESPKNYRQQLAERIELTEQQGTILSLPVLQTRLKLTNFEKCVLLMALAPEVNRRFSDLYSYLQDDKTTERPLVDLALKLFCRNDQEWQLARQRLATTSPLKSARLVRSLDLPTTGLPHSNLEQTSAANAVPSAVPSHVDRPFLLRSLCLSEALINLLLSTELRSEQLEPFCQPLPSSLPLNSNASSLAPIAQFAAPVAGIGLPSTATAAVDPLAIESNLQPERSLGFPYLETVPKPEADLWPRLIYPDHVLQRLDWIATAVSYEGLVLALSGPRGVGKTLIARALAQRLGRSLLSLDLRRWPASAYSQLVTACTRQPEAVLVVQSSEYWLNRYRKLSMASWSELICQRKRPDSLTIFSSEAPLQLSCRWQRDLDVRLTFGLPKIAERRQLWQQALIDYAPYAADIDIAHLAQRWQLTGGAIQASVAVARRYRNRQQTQSKRHAKLQAQDLHWSLRQCCRHN